MEETNELSDIVLEKNDNKALKTKRLLVIAAMIVLIFLIVLVTMKVINKPSSPDQNTKLILPPEPVSNVVSQQKEEDKLFKQIPITETTKKENDFEKMVKSLKEKEVQKQKNVDATIKAKTQKIVKKEVPLSIQQDVIQAKKIIVEQINKTKGVTKKTIRQQAKTNNKATAGAYIQVGATSRLTPDKKFLSKLTSLKYEYRLLLVQVGGKKVTKILVGPYANTKSARKVIADIKAKVNKDAFIYRVK